MRQQKNPTQASAEENEDTAIDTQQVRFLEEIPSLEIFYLRFL
jgi:hypothetical protein